MKEERRRRTKGRTDELVLESEDRELGVDGDPDVEDEAGTDDDDPSNPRPIPDVETDEEVGGGDGTGGDGRSELPDGDVVTFYRVTCRPGEEEVRDEEADAGLIESVEHEPEERRSRPLLAEDTATIELREGERDARADVLVEL
jgi:hypothetical protein